MPSSDIPAKLLNDPLPLRPMPRVRASVNWRSILLGLVGVCLICGITPYNDYVLNNTFLVGNNLPIGAVMLAFLFVVFINGPLNRWRPNSAFHSGELCVAFSMMLVSCCMPSSGLMRYFPTSLIGPWYQAQGNTEFRRLLLSLKLPDWIFPKFVYPDRADWMHDPIVTGYLSRWNPDDGPVPYWRWLRPAMTWGVFLAALYGALACMVLIVRRQWTDNERLPFPLAQIQLSLIDRPAPGRWLNVGMRSKAFWIGFIAVFAVHLWNGLAKYEPTYFAPIPVYYNLRSLFTESPWKYADDEAKSAAIFFTAVGTAYFLSAPVAFSLWAFYVLDQVHKMLLGSATGDPTTYGTQDQHFGGVIAFALMVVWIGRRHWRLVIAHSFRGMRQGERGGRYASYALTFWIFVACTAGMIGWLWLAGCALWAAAVMVLLLLTLFLVITRIIAETGLVHGQLVVPIYKPWTWLSFDGFHQPVAPETFYYGSLLQAVHYDFREVMPVYMSHGIRLSDAVVDAGAPTDRRDRRRLLLCLAMALTVGYIVSFGATLRTEYAYSATQDQQQISPINKWGASDNPKQIIVDPTLQYVQQNYRANYSPGLHWTFGFATTLSLYLLRLRFPSWPFHPIGYLMIGTYPQSRLWFSIFLGWAAKSLILKFGGPKMYNDVRPFFLGLIVGESVAAGFWLSMGLLLNAMGHAYIPVNIMPG